MDKSESSNTRKPQGNSTLDGLELARQDQLKVWLLEENRTYSEVRELLASEQGVTTSEAALCRYYQRWLAPELALQAVEEAVDPQAWRGLDTRCVEDAVVSRARQLAFSTLTERDPDVKAVQRLWAMIHAAERMKLSRERVAMEQRRLAMDEERQRKLNRPLGEWLLMRQAFREGYERMERGDPLDDIAEALRAHRAGASAGKEAGASKVAPASEAEGPSPMADRPAADRQGGATQSTS